VEACRTNAKINFTVVFLFDESLLVNGECHLERNRIFYAPINNNSIIAVNESDVNKTLTIICSICSQPQPREIYYYIPNNISADSSKY